MLEEHLWVVRDRLLIARNNFNNCIDKKEMDLIIHEINDLEKEEDRLLKEVARNGRA